MEDKKEGVLDREMVLEDIKVIRRMIDETKVGILPGMSIMIFWGIWIFIGDLFTQIMVWKKLFHYIGWGWMIMLGIAVIFNALYWPRIKHAIKGMHPYLSKQLGYCWWLLVGLNLLFTNLGLAFGIIGPGQIGFLWALVISFGLCITGIIYSKEYLFAGLCTFVGIFISAVFKDYTWLLLGVFLCLGSIIPVILAKRNFNLKEEKNNE
ncbi:MAG: hypothetical protein V1709_11525 [Planctomycetota bacterium]